MKEYRPTPEEREAGRLMTQVFREMGVRHYDEAIEIVNKILQLTPGHPLALFCRGKCCYFLGKYQNAVDDFVDALYLDPEEKIHHDLGLVYQLQGLHVQAVNCFSISVKNSPWYSFHYSARAKSWFILHQYRKCIKDMQRHIKKFKPNAVFNYKLDNMRAVLTAMSWFYLKKHDAALSCLHEAIEINEEEALAYYYLALLNILNNEWQAAEINLSKSLWFDESNNNAFLFRILAKLKNGSPNAAPSEFDKIKYINSEDAFHALAKIHEQIRAVRLNKNGEMELLYNKTKKLHSLSTHVDILKHPFFKVEDYHASI